MQGLGLRVAANPVTGFGFAKPHRMRRTSARGRGPDPSLALPVLMEQVADRPNVELRHDREGGAFVVLAFPYERALVELVRTIPNRRFDWDTREWSAPAGDWAGMKVAELLERYPELSADEEVISWLSGVRQRWIGHVRTTRHEGRGWLVLETLARADSRGAALGRGETRRQASHPVDPSGSAGVARADLARASTSPPSAACRFSRRAASRPRHGSSTSGA